MVELFLLLLRLLVVCHTQLQRYSAIGFHCISVFFILNEGWVAEIFLAFIWAYFDFPLISRLLFRLWFLLGILRLSFGSWSVQMTVSSSYGNLFFYCVYAVLCWESMTLCGTPVEINFHSKISFPIPTREVIFVMILLVNCAISCANSRRVILYIKPWRHT